MPRCPGVELHAQAIEQILQGAFLQRPDFATPAELLYILVLGIADRRSHLSPRRGRQRGARRPRHRRAWSVSPGTPSTRSAGWSIPIYPAIALTAIYLAGTLFVFLRTERERNRVRHAFSHYMAPALVERLADDPSRLKLGGETRDMTLLFSDVRGFTTISEGLDAEELTRFLNSPVHALEQHHPRRARHHRQIHGRRGDGVLERAARRSRRIRAMPVARRCA